MAEDIILDLCPPHDFRAGWSSNEVGRIYCRMCGDVRPLDPPTIGPPNAEQPAHTRTEGGSDPANR